MLCEIFKITIGLYSVVVITSDSDLKNHNFREPRFDPGYDLIFGFFFILFISRIGEEVGDAQVNSI